MKHVIVIGAGFAGLSAACFLAQAGFSVTVLEKNDTHGGRARAFTAAGFRFDMGPSWYWMPDVFDRFFQQFGKRTADYYTLRRLDPSYQVFFGDGTLQVPANIADLQQLFEQLEPGAGARLKTFLDEAARKYGKGMMELAYKPCLSLREFADLDVLKALLQLDMLQSMHKHLRRFFHHPRLLQLTEFPSLFLGALPRNTPALYSLMNYADMQLGTWYPQGGMVKIADALYALAQELGVAFRFDTPVTAFRTEGRSITKVFTPKQSYAADAVIAACDYRHTEKLLPPPFRNYSDAYWDSRTMAPSSVLFYLGFNKKLEGLQHHNLLFDTSFDKHADALYTTMSWPEEPLMYVCCPSKTDATVAPPGCENLFVLIPVAAGLQDDADIRNHYQALALQRLEARLGIGLRDALVYCRSYAGVDFTRDYNAFKGNAYGLANTLRQTAFLKPSVRNRKLSNLYYAGQLTVPGPGVPPALISGEIAARAITRQLQQP